MALGGNWPAKCTTPDWRQCAMDEDPIPVAVSTAD
jgi:hypothetical protein